MKGQDKPKKAAKKPAQKSSRNAAPRSATPARRLPGSTSEPPPGPRASGKTALRTLAGMDPHALAVLEFPGDRGAARGCDRERARRRARARADARPRRPRTRSPAGRRSRPRAIALLDHAAEPSLAGVADVRAAAEHAARDGVLGPRDLRQSRRPSTVGARGAAGARRGGRAGAAAARRARAGRAVARLARRDDRARRRGGRLRSARHASPALRRLRTSCATGKQRVTEELAALARSSELSEFLQERFVTERGGRPVLAVKRRRARTGAGRRPRLVELRADAVRRAVRDRRAEQPARRGGERRARGGRADPARALAAVGERAAELEALVEATAALDLALARGTLSRRWRGAAVERRDEVRLLSARHPLLDPATAVPIDLELGDLRALVVSGPNTGGKTVALKTLGPRRAAPPGGPAAAGGRGDAAGLRPRARRRRRRAVDRDEPLDLLGAPAQHRLDPRGGDGALARAARRARRRHRSGRGLGARAGAAGAARAARRG